MFEGKEPIDLPKVAQHVGLPGRENCGACHFNGGGGDGVKRGDLDSSLITPPRAVDVHMSVDGANFARTRCHVSDEHVIAGSRYDMIAKDAKAPAIARWPRRSSQRNVSWPGTGPRRC
ncbi:hypothetical protein [Pinisolibacter aquiterrae]|uniref:hypothetical protein n=1 Tax=Pinisolibacter aquiterrae TaxID=2815579 RepID=UPI001C3D8920|nr:hypothetical protein [Pinisolibacter aquiterrae]MBV5265262.1 hypothetical protein [Pinisolibacter aquiterrae]MCC8235409.1 hypothetical protein [Pinisolibacter aquiterrae]